MGIVLHEVAHAHQAMQRTRGLVSMAGTELGQAQRQVTVALQPLVEYLDMAGTVHRLHRVVTVLRMRGKHHVAKLVPVAGFLPQRTVHHLRRVDFLVAFVADFLTDVVFHGKVDCPALVVPEHHARRLFLGMEQSKLFADFTMVALLGFCEAMQVGIELFLVGPGRAIDALQHFIV